MKCAFCGKEMSRNLTRHLSSKHGKSLIDNTLKLNNIELKDLPKCKYCDKIVYVTDIIHLTCSSKSCKEKMRREKLSESVKDKVKDGTFHFLHENLEKDSEGNYIYAKKQHESCIKNGNFNFSSENRKLDENGKDIIALNAIEVSIKNKTHPLIKENRKTNENGKDIISLKAFNTQINRGTFTGLKSNREKDENGKDLRGVRANATKIKNNNHPWQKCNRKLDENGKDIIAVKSSITRKLNNTQICRNLIIENPQDFNIDYFKSLVDDKGIFNIKECMNHFNVARTTASHYKIKFLGYIKSTEEGTSKEESNIINFIKSLNSEIKILDHFKDLLNPYELDIYLPDYNLAIEFDGIYWHSNKYKDKNYHVNKTNLCESKGIKLLHIFENEWINPIKREIWKSIIKQHLGLSEVIYARECEVKILNSKITNNFLNENHLQGKYNSKYNYGLFYRNKLVSLMTFGKSRFDKSFNWELLRFCNLKGYRIIGGASRLLSHFRNDHKGTIISYANRRWSNGKLYESLGFEKDKILNPEYFYTKDYYNLLSRQSCMKHKLPKILGENFNKNLTEKENMKKNGYKIIYDCGNLRYILR